MSEIGKDKTPKRARRPSVDPRIKKAVEDGAKTVIFAQLGIQPPVEATKAVLDTLPDTQEGKMARYLIDRLSEDPNVITPGQLKWLAIGAASIALAQENFDSITE